VKTSIKPIADDSIFAAINKFGQRTSAQNFTILVCDKASINSQTSALEKNILYYGIKASKRIGNAVLRNKIKRRLRALLRNLVRQENSLTQKVCVIIPKKSCAEIEFAKLELRVMQTISGKSPSHLQKKLNN
jgi:ribonuclease P protein component